MRKIKKYEIVIGIDAGVHTGYAIWNKKTKTLIVAKSLKIHEAMVRVKMLYESNSNTLVRVEDARQRKWFGNAGREKLQGAGSVKRDSQIWEDYLKDLGVDFVMVAPKNNTTKLNAESFKQITGYQGKTNEHARDAAMLCFGF